jgi:hypothetical protein
MAYFLFNSEKSDISYETATNTLSLMKKRVEFIPQNLISEPWHVLSRGAFPLIPCKEQGYSILIKVKLIFLQTCAKIFLLLQLFIKF